MKLKPFDLSMGDDMSMYDNLPYKRDSDKCNAGAIALYSGNILKYYHCSLGEVLELNDMDNLAVLKIQAYLKQEQKRLSSTYMDNVDVIPNENYQDEYEDEFSMEQLEQLVGNNGHRRNFLDNYDDED